LAAWKIFRPGGLKGLVEQTFFVLEFRSFLERALDRNEAITAQAK